MENLTTEDEEYVDIFSDGDVTYRVYKSDWDKLCDYIASGDIEACRKAIKDLSPHNID